jgi:2-dehydropantoate 2-reductase
MENVVFLGMGAVGMTFASQFADRGYPFHFVCDSPRKEAYERRKSIVNGRAYSFPCLTPSEIAEPPDFVFVAVKEYQLQEAINLLEKTVGPDTVVCSLLNGIDSEEIIGARLGPEKVLPCFVARMDSTRQKDELVYSSPGQIVFGEVDGTFSPRMRRLAALLEDAGVLYEASSEILRKMWWKFMVNVGINQTGAILKAPYRIFQEVPQSLEAAFAAMREVMAVASCSGIPLSEEDLQECVRMLMKFNPEGKNSMLQDLEAGRKMEVETFAGKVCRLGERYGVATPVNRLYYNLLKTLEWQSTSDRKR